MTSPPESKTLNTSLKNSFKSLNSCNILSKNPLRVCFLVSTYSVNEKVGVVVVLRATLFASLYLKTLLSGFVVSYNVLFDTYSLYQYSKSLLVVELLESLGWAFSKNKNIS